jgi:hypothetical protein
LVGDFKFYFDPLILGEKKVAFGSTLRNISPLTGPLGAPVKKLPCLLFLLSNIMVWTSGYSESRDGL